MFLRGAFWNIGGLKNLLKIPLTLCWLKTFTILFFAETQETEDSFFLDGFSKISNLAIESLSGHAKGGVAFFLSLSQFGNARIEKLDSFADWLLPVLIYLPSIKASILLVGVYFPRYDFLCLIDLLNFPS